MLSGIMDKSVLLWKRQKDRVFVPVAEHRRGMLPPEAALCP